MRTLLFIACVMIAGCCPEKVAVPALQQAWNVMKVEYVAYIDADTKLSPEAKVTRKRTAEEFSKTLEELRK